MKLKASKDLAGSQAATKKLLQVLKDETSNISDLGTKIRLDNAEYADRVAELQKVTDQRCCTKGWYLFTFMPAGAVVIIHNKYFNYLFSQVAIDPWICGQIIHVT